MPISFRYPVLLTCGTVLAGAFLVSPALFGQTADPQAIDPTSSNSYAEGINASGQIAGYFDLPIFPPTEHAFLFSAGVVTDLGTLGGDDSVATAINDAGQIAGYSSTTVDSTVPQDAFLYSQGTMTNLGTLGGQDSTGTGINNSGQVVGYSNLQDGYQQAFRYSGGSMTALGPGTLSANGINQSGQIVGDLDSEPMFEAFINTKGVITKIDNFSAKGINASGQVVGDDFVAGTEYHAGIYTAGAVQDLGTFGGSVSEGLALNDLGNVVGQSFTADGSLDALFYSKGTGLEDLNALCSSFLVTAGGPMSGFVELESATGINNSDQICGWGEYWNGANLSTQAFLLDLPDVPEPASDLLLLVGASLFLGVAAYRRSLVGRIFLLSPYFLN